MKVEATQAEFERMRNLLQIAKLHFKLIFGITATRPHIKYPKVFSFGSHVASGDELALSSVEEEHALAALEHAGTYLAATQVHTVLERVHPHPFKIAEPEIRAAFHISRLIRNAFAHNPFAPVWKVGDSWGDCVLTVSNVIDLKTTDLDGKSVLREHYGGPIAILRFIDYAESVVDLRNRQRAAPEADQ